MARNVEIKARIASIESVLPLVAAMSDTGPIELLQDDTFFCCANGRLKLRVIAGQEAQLIFYQRADAIGPKESRYVIHATASPDSLRNALVLAYGHCGRVRKHRTLFLVGRTRVHLDRVEGLGDFLELEVVLDDGEPTDSGVAVANELLAALSISTEQLVPEAYVDLVDRAHDDHGSMNAPGEAQ